MDITMEATNSQLICLKNSLLDLNEDCLLLVFNYLNIIDLINVSETCKKLQSVAKIASKKHTIFRLWDYKCYRNKVNEPRTLGKIFTFTAPFIVCLELWHGVDANYMHEAIEVQGNFNLDRILEGIQFTNLKSLVIDNSSLLEWIHFYNLEELKVREVNCNDLNNFTNGLTTLKKLTIGRFHENISSDELRRFLEKNPNIESLDFFSLFPLRFPYNVLPQLRNLTKLSLAVGNCQPEWYSFLAIDVLTELKVDIIGGMSDANCLSLIIYLENLALKKTLKKIELENMSFGGQALNALELLDVTKLRIASPRCDNHFFMNFGTKRLLNLTHLDVMSSINGSDLFNLIQKFKNLQRLKVYYSDKFNNERFLLKVPELFDSSTISRPPLTLSNYCEKDHIMIFFDLCTYNVITYPNADLKQWDGENVSMERSSMFSEWFDYRVKAHETKMMRVSRRNYNSGYMQKEANNALKE